MHGDADAMTAVAPTERARRRTHLFLAALLLLAALLRFYRIGYQSYWNDEGTSVALASRSLGLILQGASQDIHPPLYYVLLHGWMQLFGRGEVAVRALSALLGAMCVGATYTLARRVWGDRTALLAALLAAVSPLQVYYAQEARMYMLAAALACSSMATWHALLNDGLLAGKGWLLRSAPYLILTALLTYTHYTGFTLLLAQNVGVLWWLLTRKAIWRERGALAARWALLQLIVGALYTPWLVLSWQALTQWPAVGHAGGLLSYARTAAQTLALGTAVEPSLWLRWAGYGAATLALGGALVDLRTRGARSPWSLYLLVPLASMGIYSLARPMFKPKFALLVAPAFCVLQAVAIVALAQLGRGSKQRWWGVSLAIMAAAIPLGTSGATLWQQYHEPATFRDDYRGIVSYIEAAAGPHDAMLINAPSQIETVELYASGNVATFPLPLQRPLDREVTLAQLEKIAGDHERIYGIFWATDESDPERVIEGWLDQHTYRAMDAWFGNLRLVVYATSAAQSALEPRNITSQLGESIQLEQVAITPRIMSGDILQVELTWRATMPLSERYKVFLHLVDGEGQIVAQRDAEPVGFGRPTDGWQVGERIVDLHGIVVRPGTPPGDYQLLLGIYLPETGQRLPVQGHEGGDSVPLGEVLIERATTPPPVSALDLTVPDDVALAGVRLVGHSAYLAGHGHAPDAPLRPGDDLELVLYWQRTEGADPIHEALFELRDARHQRQPFTLPLGGSTYPSEEWATEEVVRAVQRVQISPEMAPGRLHLWIEDADGRWQRIDRLSLVGY